MRSQSNLAISNSASRSGFDPQYFQQGPETGAPSRGTGVDETSPYVVKKPLVEFREKKDEAKQVGWWLGKVGEIHEDYFEATLEDEHGRISIAEFSKEEISPRDLNLLAPDVRFSYTVTRIDKRTGREYVSKISLSGSAIWTERDSKMARESFEELFPEDVFDF